MSHKHEYPKPSVSVDMIVFREIDSVPHVLLIQRRYEPYENCWAVPGGFMNIDETAEMAAQRELEEETGLTADRIEQLHTFSAVDRDPRGRVLSVAFLCDVDVLQQPVAADDAKLAAWFPMTKLPELAFDHDEMIQLGITRVSQQA